MSNSPTDGPLERYTQILESLAGQSSGLGLSDVSDATVLTSATTHRLLHSLVGVGLVHRKSSRTYVLGDRFFRLAAMASNSPSVATMSEPFLIELAEKFGETAYLAKLVGDEIEPVSMTQTESRNSAIILPGRRLPLYATSAGKAVLANQSDKFIDRYLSKPRTAYTQNTRIREEEIRSELAAIRKKGISVSDNEFEPGLLNYACPIFSFGSQVVFAIAVIGLRDRLKKVPKSDIENALASAAERLARKIDVLIQPTP